MEAKIGDGKLHITIDLEEPKPSATGKTLVVASTRGNITTAALYKGKAITVGLTAYVKP